MRRRTCRRAFAWPAVGARWSRNYCLSPHKYKNRQRWVRQSAGEIRRTFVLRAFERDVGEGRRVVEVFFALDFLRELGVGREEHIARRVVMDERKVEALNER